MQTYGEVVSVKEEGSKQTIYERAEIGERVIHRVRQILKDVPLEVIGHMESQAICCRNGTVALVRIDLDEVMAPAKRTRTTKKKP